MNRPDPLDSIIKPASIAVVGASEDPHKIGGRPIHYMKHHGYQGAILPINPKRATIQGLPAYASLAALPCVPELVVVVVAGDAAVACVDECAALGVGAVVIIASGFGETGPAGLAVQQAMVARARSSGMRIVGPNSQGVANFGNGAIANFSTLFSEIEPCDGPVAIASQSGGMSQAIYGMVRNQGIGVRHIHASGNEADVTVADLAYAMVQDPDVELLLMYLESIADPALLAHAAAIARERGLPIVALKSGRSIAGQRTARAHTGALANDDRVVDSFLRQHGIWRVRDPRALGLAVPAYLKGWRPRGRRLVVVSNSGASCVLSADESEALNLPLAPLAQQTRDAVAACLPGFASTANPIDITAALLSNSHLFGQVLPLLANDSAADLLLVNLPVAGAGYDVEAFSRDAAAAASASGKPVLVTAWQESVAKVFRAAGVVTLRDESDAMRVLAQLTSHAELMRRHRADWPEPVLPALPASPPGMMRDTDSLALLAAQGLPIIEHGTSRHDGAQAFTVRARIDPSFGPVVIFGASGASAGAIPEQATLLVPFDAEDVAQALRALRIAPLPDEAAGAADAIDIAALIDVVLRSARLMHHAQAEIVSITLNPVIVGPIGKMTGIAGAQILRR